MHSEAVAICAYLHHVRASMNGPEEWNCEHCDSETGMCQEADCPLVAQDDKEEDQ